MYNVGFFQNLENAVISDFIISNDCNISSYNSGNIGSIAGVCKATKILNCSSSSNINCDKLYYCEIGGIVGVADSNSKLVNCFYDGEINADIHRANGGQEEYHIGGICGYAKQYVNINNCKNTGSLSGISGQNSSSTADQLKTIASIGGIVGLVEHCNLDSYTNEGRVYHIVSNLASISGGITRKAEGSIFSNCKNLGSVTGRSTGKSSNYSAMSTGSYIGGVIGLSVNSNVINNCSNHGFLLGYVNDGCNQCRRYSWNGSWHW
nr:hypothetical protein [uncultured Draconibacterium sp.]